VNGGAEILVRSGRLDTQVARRAAVEPLVYLEEVAGSPGGDGRLQLAQKGCLGRFRDEALEIRFPGAKALGRHDRIAADVVAGGKCAECGTRPALRELPRELQVLDSASVVVGDRRARRESEEVGGRREVGAVGKAPWQAERGEVVAEPVEQRLAAVPVTGVGVDRGRACR
jgi:hypothetical protein